MTASSPDDRWAQLEVVLVVETAGGEVGAAEGHAIGDDLLLTVSSRDEPLTVPVSATPLQLAFLVGLGPRPVPGAEHVPLAVPAVPDARRATLLGAVPEEDRVDTPLASPEVMVWTAAATWVVGETEHVRVVSVADAGDGGIALLENAEEGMLIRPCTATDVWLRLADLLPYGFELRGEEPALPADSALDAAP